MKTTNVDRPPGSADASGPAGQPPHRDNNFDCLRWLAATLVVFGHSRLLLGRSQVVVWTVPIATLGVLIFFSVSGYLVTQSWMRDAQSYAFFRKRGLRIFPALIVCVSLTVVLLGPALTTQASSAYWLSGHTWSYFVNCALKMQYALPGLFIDNLVPSVTNGSLWTLPVEFVCYIAIAAIGRVIGRQHRRAAVTTIITAGLLSIAGFHFTYLYDGRPIVAYGTDLGAASRVMPYFFVGSVLARLRRVSFRLDIALMLALALTITEGAALWRTTTVLGFVAIPYVVIALGVRGTPILERWGRRGDFSYGLYLYAYPVQQTIVQLLGPDTSTNVLFLLSEAASMILAVMSWHLVEKTALTFKRSKAQAGGGRALVEASATGN